ncbi:MAG: ABC transporter permease, partial [Erysipelotrichaceae bacterium]|nr:ABC transporter permease [Erysipelotrichaceae bacterium]
LTALSLSFNNLLTKKGRTILTSFAGSIGIIGIALILALSQGFQNYIDKIQEDTLSSYPLTITKESTDMTSMILAMSSNNDVERSDGTLIEKQYMANMFASVSMNELKPFKKYVEEHYDEIRDDVTNVSYSYTVSPVIYTVDTTGKLVKINPNSMLSSFTSGSVSSLMTSAYSAYGFGVFTEMTDDMEMVTDNYELLAGRWPNSYDEMIIVLSERDGISDLLVYSLGLRDFSELNSMLTKRVSGEEIENSNEIMKLTYDDLLGLDLRLVHAYQQYRFNSKYNIYEDMSADTAFMEDVYERALKLKIVGIVCSKPGSSSNVLSPGVNYTKDLTAYIIDSAADSTIVHKQLDNRDVDVFSGKTFEEKNKESQEQLNFEDMISVDENKLSQAFKVNVDLSSLGNMNDMEDKIMTASKNVIKDLDDVETTLVKEMAKQFSGAAKAIIQQYPEVFGFTVPDVSDENACPLGYREEYNPLSGCMLPSEDSEDYEEEIVKYQEVKGASLDPSQPSTIWVYEDRYEEYVTFNDTIVEAFKNMAITKDILKSDEVVTIARSCLDEYVKEAKKLAETGPVYGLLGLVKKSDLETLDIDAIVAKGMSTSESQNALKSLATNATEEYSYLLVAKGIGEVTADILSPLQALGNRDLMTIDTSKFAEAFRFNMSQEELQRIMSAMMNSDSISSAATNLTSLGYQDIEEPTSISFFFNSFEAKENFLKWLDTYNESVEEERKINYTDITGILMSSVKTIVDSVTYVLIAFVSISLIVSSIMIAVITLISVMERTKEIGILRAMGASKRNVSSIFNAETFIIGLLSGLIGIGTTYLFIVPINRIIHSLTDNPNINAVLPGRYALILIVISVILTIIAGFIPSKKAAKQDPVVALRTE